MTDEIDIDIETHWGCQLLNKSGDVFTTRWNPGYGSGIYVPYTEAEARADVDRLDRDGYGKRLVTRTETKVISVVTTEWIEVKD